MPLKSSVSMKLEKKSLIGVVAAMAGGLFPDVPGRHDPEAHDHEPDQRHRDEDLPAQAHDLVVAETRESGAGPEEHGREHEGLDEQPEPVPEPHRARDPAGLGGG